MRRGQQPESIEDIISEMAMKRLKEELSEEEFKQLEDEFNDMFT